MKEELKNKGLFGGIVLAAVTASLCCTIPLFFAGAGVTAIVVAEKFATLRPYLLGLTGLMLAAGFYYAYRPKSCEPGGVCATPEGRHRVRLGLWLAAAFAVALTTIPYWSGAVVRGMAPASQVSSDLRADAVPLQKTTLQVSGMFCEMCVAVLQKELAQQQGVHSARIQFSGSKDVVSKAEVEFDPSKISLVQIQSLIEKAGYQVKAAMDGTRVGG